MGIADVVGQAVGAIEKYFPSAEERERFKADLTSQVQAQVNASVADARDMQKAVKSRMPTALGIYALAFFSFMLLWAMLSGSGLFGWIVPPLPKGVDPGTLILMGFTLIIREVTATFTFFQGSSNGSKDKDATIAQMQGGQ